MSKPAFHFVACCVIAFVVNAGSPAQDRTQISSPCDPTLRPKAGTLGYRQRDTIRCEGLYRAPTSGEIELISFEKRLPTGDARAKGRIELEVPAVPGHPNKIVIRVSTLREDVYYQLDAIASTATSFGWPTSEVLDQVGLTSRDLGFLGWRDIGKEHEFVPLALKESDSVATAESSDVIVVRSPLALEWVKWRLYRTDKPAKQGKWSAVPGSGFPGGFPIEIRLPSGRVGPHVIDVYAMPENRDIPERLSARLLF